MRRWIATLAPFMQLVTLAALSSCDDAPPSPATGTGAPATSGSIAPATPARASASSAGADTRPGASAAAVAGAPRPFTGTVDVKQAKVKVQSGVKVGAWRKDEGKELVGKCDVDLILAGDGTISGTVKGALGDLVVTGAWDGKLVHAEVASRDPAADGAVRGTIEGALEGDALTGKLRIASNDASLVREGDVSLKPKG